MWVFSNLELRSPEKLLKKEANQIQHHLTSFPGCVKTQSFLNGGNQYAGPRIDWGWGVDNTFLPPPVWGLYTEVFFFIIISLSFIKRRPLSLIHKYLLSTSSGGKTQQYLNS